MKQAEKQIAEMPTCQDMTIIELRMSELYNIIYEQSMLINSLIQISSKVSNEISCDSTIGTSLNSPCTNILTIDLQLVTDKLRDNLYTLSCINEILHKTI